MRDASRRKREVEEIAPTDFRRKLERVDQGRGRHLAMFKPIECGGLFELIVTANCAAKCTPRKDFKDPFAYNTMQVAIKEGSRWIDPRNDSRFWRNMTGRIWWDARWQDGLTHPYAGDLSIADIQKVYDILREDGDRLSQEGPE